MDRHQTLCPRSTDLGDMKMASGQSGKFEYSTKTFFVTEIIVFNLIVICDNVTQTVLIQISISNFCSKLYLKVSVYEFKSDNVS